MSAIEYNAEQKAIQSKLAAANINAESFLATDYLNHFNEIAMLLEMIPDMPELLEDAQDWKPKSYENHFLDSGFQQKELAVQAFEMCPQIIKAPFLHNCALLDHKILATLDSLKKVGAVDRGLSGAASEFIRQRVAEVQSLLLELNGIIHGKLPAKQPSDRMIKTFDEKVILEVADSREAESVQSQEDIDKLFS